MSKYFWQFKKESNTTCDNIQDAVHGLPSQQLPRTQKFNTQYSDLREPGWLTEFVRTYLMFLCGEDCAVRYATGRANLDDIERQAEENLRHSFAVVGLLTEMDSFYQMVNARVQYMDTTLNTDVAGGEHSTKQSGEAERCKKRFKDPEFQQQLLEASPELRALNRLYHVGIEVNRFQKEELQQCSSWAK